MEPQQLYSMLQSQQQQGRPVNRMFVHSVLGAPTEPSTFAQSYRLLLENYQGGAAGAALNNNNKTTIAAAVSYSPLGVSPTGFMPAPRYPPVATANTAFAPPPQPMLFPLTAYATQHQPQYQHQQQLQHQVMHQMPVQQHGMLNPLFPPAAMYARSISDGGHPLSSGMRMDPSVMEAHRTTYTRSRQDKVSETGSTTSDDDGSEQSWQDSKTKRTRLSASTSKRQIKDKTPGLGGERRLKIDFTSLGTVGPKPQYFGKSGMVIPNGLSGTHEMHSQHWKFQITHQKTDDDVVVISWTVVNLNSNKTTSMTETPFQAKERQKTGNTICSVVMRKAIEQRVLDLEEELKDPAAQSNPAQVTAIQSLIRELRPKQRNEGILFFGLRHACVQKRSEQSDSAGASEVRL